MTVLDAALDYAARGWRVVPIIPGRKHPGLDAWQEAATTDPDIIRQWWQRWPTHGVGIATGAGSGIFVLDVDNGPGKDGDESLADLQATYGPLPETVEVITGSGGRHLYYRVPEGVDIRNDQAARLGVGLDIRGDGGQVVAPPTIHPSGRRYEWEASNPDDVADAPGWLIDLLTRTPEGGARRERAPRRDDHDDLPGTWFETTVTWPELLEADGAVYLGERKAHRLEGQRYELWGRPPYPGEETWLPHTSATLYYGGSDVLKVFTPNWWGVDEETGEVWRLTEGETYTRFGYYAARHHGGNLRAAASACARMRTAAGADPADGWLRDALAASGGQEWTDALGGVTDAPSGDLGAVGGAVGGAGGGPDDGGFGFANLREVLDSDYRAPVPDILHRTDGRALLYSGRVNALYGESGSGKSWLAMVAAAELLAAGRGVIYLDYEDHRASVLARFQAIGVPDDLITDGLLYTNPERGWNPAAARHLEDAIVVHDVGLVVIDSTGEAMALDGAKPNDDDATARWFAEYPRRLARLGPAVLILDHLPKDPTAPTGFAIGSQRKRAALDGAGWRLDAKVAPARGQTGHLKLICTKDRNGAFQAGLVAAEVEVRSTTDGGRVEVVVGPYEAVTRPTTLMGRISEWLEEFGPASQRTILSEVDGKDAGLKKALHALVQEDYVDARPRAGRGGGFEYHHVTRFVPDDDLAQFVPVDKSAGSGDEDGSSERCSETAAQPRPNRGPTSEGRGSEPRPPRPRGSVESHGRGPRFGPALAAVQATEDGRDEVDGTDPQLSTEQGSSPSPDRQPPPENPLGLF